MTAKVCPFCGIVTEQPHETQEICIAALHAEIARMRELLQNDSFAFPARNEPRRDASTRPNR